jgi:hypothetical protein
METRLIVPEFDITEHEPERHNRKGGMIWTPDLVKMPRYQDFRAAMGPVAALPTPPMSFGLNNMPTGADFGPEGMWGNMYNAGAGAVADCCEAAFIHSIMYWTWMAKGAMAPFVDLDARNLGNPATDNGTILSDAISRWQTSGITDDASIIHTIGTALQLNTGDINELAEAAYLLGPVGIGINLCTTWQNAFAGVQIWDTVASPVSTGTFHYVPVIGRSANGNFIVITFGGLMQMTPAGFQQFTSGGFAFITDDYFDIQGLSPLRYTKAQVQQYINAMNMVL